jgi:hypothetical protein
MADDIRLVISVEQSSLLKAITIQSHLRRGLRSFLIPTPVVECRTAIRANAKAVEAAAIAEKQRLKVLREEKIALDQKNKAEAANSAELQRFRISTDQVYAAEQKLLRLKKMLRAEVDAGNMSMRQAAAVQMQYKRSLTAMGGGMQQTARKTNQLGVMMQQTGYQVGDFAVQVGSGQNVMVAFGQQATQLVGTMAMFAKTTKMIALFSGLGILIPVISGIGAAFMRSGAEAKEATKKITKEVQTLGETISSLNNIQETTALGFQSGLNLAFGKAAGNVARLVESINSLRFKDAMLPVQQTVETVRAGIDAVQINMQKLLREVNKTRDRKVLYWNVNGTIKFIEIFRKR